MNLSNTNTRRLLLAALLSGALFSALPESSIAEGLTGYYYLRAKKSGPVVTGPPDYKVIDKQIDFGITTWAWQPHGWTEHFSAYWSGWIYIEKEDSYIFSTFSDDGSALYINDNKVVENFSGTQEPSWKSGTIRLTSGYHKVEITYYNWKGASGMGLYWDRGSGASIVPGEILFPEDYISTSQTP